MRATVILFVSILFAGCGDRIDKLVNEKFPPVGVDEQRATAIASASDELAKIVSPNLAMSFAIKDFSNLTNRPELKALGIEDLAIVGEEQLLRITIKFKRRFGEQDAQGDGELQTFLRALQPEIAGRIIFYAGLASTLSAPPQGHATLQLKLLPSLSRLEVSNLILRDKMDAAKVVAPVVKLLNKYKDNLSGELSRMPFASTTLPIVDPKPIDIRRSLTFSDSGAKASVEITGDPIAMPLRLSGVAWVVDQSKITALVQVVPKDSPSPPPTPVDRKFKDVKERAANLVHQAFGFEADDEDSTWAAVRKDLVAFGISSAFAQANACATVAVTTDKIKSSNKVTLPSGAGIDCSSSRVCDPTRQNCTFSANKDTRNCHQCLIPSPRICSWTPWGNRCVGGGGCITHGNEPVCEAAKAAQNLVYDIDANKRKAECDTANAIDKAACDTEKTVEKAFCDTKREVLNAIARTGNFANVDTELQLSTDNLRVCLRDFKLAPGLDGVTFGLDVSGQAKANINVAFTPLDIVGHLTCQFPWSRNQEFAASLRDSRVNISSTIAISAAESEVTGTFKIAELPVKAKLVPSPIEYLLKSPQMMLSCPIARGVAPLAFALTPFVKELRGEIDYSVPGRDAMFKMKLPEPTVEQSQLRVTSKITKTAILVSATVVGKR